MPELEQLKARIAKLEQDAKEWEDENSALFEALDLILALLDQPEDLIEEIAKAVRENPTEKGFRNRVREILEA